MESLYLLIPLSVVLVFVIGALFWWSLRNGQYDDLEGPAYRMLLDDKDEFPAAPQDPPAAGDEGGDTAPRAKKSEPGASD